MRELRAENARLERLAAFPQQAQKTFVELVERAPFGIYVVDSQFRIAMVNSGSQEGAFRTRRGNRSIRRASSTHGTTWRSSGP